MAGKVAFQSLGTSPAPLKFASLGTRLGVTSQGGFLLGKDNENTEKHIVLSNEDFLCKNGKLC